MLSKIRKKFRLHKKRLQSPLTFIKKTPKLKSPYLVAAWPGMGSVAIKCIQYLQQQLGAVPFAKIDPENLFSTQTVYFQDNAVQTITRPQSTFYYYHAPNAPHDLILFVGEAQPIPGKEFYLGQIVLDLLKKFKGQRLYTFAAAPTSIHHRETPKVWAVPTHKRLVNFLKHFSLNLMSSGQISGMNGLLLGMAKNDNIEGVCLLGETPHYTVNIENPRSSLAVLKVLSAILEITISFKSLEELASQTDNEIDFYIRQIRDDLSKEVELKKSEKTSYLH